MVYMAIASLGCQTVLNNNSKKPEKLDTSCEDTPDQN